MTQRTRSFSWSNPLIISLFVVFGFLLVIFGLLQYRSGDQATLPPQILKNRSMLAGAWYQACCDGTLAVTDLIYLAMSLAGAAAMVGLSVLLRRPAEPFNTASVEQRLSKEVPGLCAGETE